MVRYRLDVAYHGREFHGWQKQPGARTVQGELELWLSRFVGGTVRVTGAGRTDAGVHAFDMPAHFDWSEPIDTVRLRRRLRAALPHDLSILRLHRVADRFHARYSAVGRRYSYQIRLGSWPFAMDRQWQIHGALDIGTLNACAALVIGRHDFSGFCRMVSRAENNRCTVCESNWKCANRELVYTIRADRFLHEMVRLLVGTFVAAARGRWPPEHIAGILSNGSVGKCGDAAPPHGLTLEEVYYPVGIGEPIA